MIDNRIRIIQIDIDILRAILENAILAGGEGLIDIDSDELDEEAVHNIAESAIEQIIQDGRIL